MMLKSKLILINFVLAYAIDFSGIGCQPYQWIFRRHFEVVVGNATRISFEMISLEKGQQCPDRFLHSALLPLSLALSLRWEGLGEGA
jgi:hypothetical protein